MKTLEQIPKLKTNKSPKLNRTTQNLTQSPLHLDLNQSLQINCLNRERLLLGQMHPIHHWYLLQPRACGNYGMHPQKPHSQAGNMRLDYGDSMSG